MDLYYITDRDEEQKLLVYCQDGAWRLYVECEKDWNNLVFLAPSDEIYNVYHSINEQDERHWLKKNNRSVQSNSRSRSLYVKLKWNKEDKSYDTVDKTLAESYGDACQKLEVNPEKVDGWFVFHYSDIYQDEFKEKVDNLPLSIL